MSEQAATTRAALLARAEAVILSEPSFSRFLKAVVEASDAEDLAQVPPEAFEARFRKSYSRLGKRELASYSVHVSPPLAPGEPETVDVYSADTPFIVDSVLAAIRAQGGTVRELVHPVIEFDPATYRVLDQPGPGSRLESFLHVEIDPLVGTGAREELRLEIERTLIDVARAVGGWAAMLKRLREAIASWHDHAPKAPPPDVAEGMHFLGWLADRNFTFLGMREYRLDGSGPAARLLPVHDSELGILEDPTVLFLRSGTTLVEMTEQHRDFLAEPAPLMVTKANIRSRVHRRSYMDYIGVKLFDEAGETKGELRILGLFTSQSFATPNAEVPLIRRKVEAVLEQVGLDPDSHDGKALLNVLDTYPREELFQIGVPQLIEFSTLIMGLADRPRVRVLSRIDRFDNFVSILVFVPRDRYDSAVRAKIGEYLAKVYDGHVSAYYPSFPEGELVRVHFIIGRSGGDTPEPERETLEAAIGELTRSFADRLLLAAPDPAVVKDFLAAFPSAYEARNDVAAALEDIAVIRPLPDGGAIALKLSAPAEGASLKLYHRGTPIPLSDRVPMLENFGFRVIDEQTFVIAPAESTETYLHDMLLTPPEGWAGRDVQRIARIENAILAVWRREAESDRLNELTSRAGIGWQDVEVLRALLRYLKQLGVPYSREYLALVATRHADVAVALVKLFHALNDPHFAGHRERAAGAARETISAAIAATTSLDEDRILRRLVNLAEGVVRTNAYQRDGSGSRRPALALKFDCTKLEDLPEPRPYREIFVYSPRVEGLHLRFGPIARGGLRWSDRPEDFRTEVLGLVKAQQVKNAIIVPVGAKGAFVPRHLPVGGGRDAVMEEGTAAYKIFVSSLLDLTDSIEGNEILPPPDVVRRDGDDPYLVVAADKGTASFSDIANDIALDREFWLGDAFASGGSAGYDHKEMGITARGGWEAVKRHFRELDRDIQTSAFTAVGVGDMSGDVFGNGALLSPEMRLVAAFDHRDIFIDPAPDPATSLAERKRLFELPRSSWQDYDKALISEGGGVFPRSLKDVPLTQVARARLGLGMGALTPDMLIRAILCAQVDLIWFGGIGTYVRATGESDAEAGDKANDGVRVTGKDIRALVIGEGANLGMTQKGRVEYALAGGRLNTDAIDNSAGVNSSDLEVNIKIALGTLVRAGTLTTEARNTFLHSMTDEVAELCLRNNYLQTLAISVEEARGLSAFAEHLSLVDRLEARGELNRSVERLPDDATLRARAQSGRGFTRPELAVLLAYAKISANAALLDSDVPDDPYLGRDLYRYFPPTLVATYEATITEHRLRREVIATVLSNAMINRGGPAFVEELMATTNADVGRVAAAYAAARDVFGTPELNAALDALDGKLAGATQLALYGEVQALLKRQTLWFLRNQNFEAGIAPLVERYQAGLRDIRKALAGPLKAVLADAAAERVALLTKAGADAATAQRFAELGVVALGADIVLVAERAGVEVSAATEAFFGVLARFGLGRVIAEGNAIVLADRFERMALDRALANLMRAQRELTADALADGGVAAWEAARPEAVKRTAEAVRDLTEGDMTVSRLSVAAGLLADLSRAG